MTCLDAPGESLTPLRLSVIGERERPVSDRVSYILVRDGLDSHALERSLALDDRFPYYCQPHKSEFTILREVADFLGVSFDWLVTGKGSPDREQAHPAPPAVVAVDSVIVAHNAARSIRVENRGDNLGKTFGENLGDNLRDLSTRNPRNA